MEKEAAEDLVSELNGEPTRGVLFRSAAYLAFRLQRYDEASELIDAGLLGVPFPEIAVELRGLKEQISRRTRSERPVISMASRMRLGVNIFKQLPDIEIEAFRSGDHDVFSTFYDFYYDGLYEYIFSLVPSDDKPVEDKLMQTISKVWEKRKSFKNLFIEANV